MMKAARKDQILQWLMDHPNHWWSLRDIAKGINVEKGQVSWTTKDLVNEKKIIAVGNRASRRYMFTPKKNPTIPPTKPITPNSNSRRDILRSIKFFYDQNASYITVPGITLHSRAPDRSVLNNINNLVTLGMLQREPGIHKRSPIRYHFKGTHIGEELNALIKEAEIQPAASKPETKPPASTPATKPSAPTPKLPAPTPKLPDPPKHYLHYGAFVTTLRSDLFPHKTSFTYKDIVECLTKANFECNEHRVRTLINRAVHSKFLFMEKTTNNITYREMGTPKMNNNNTITSTTPATRPTAPPVTPTETPVKPGGTVFTLKMSDEIRVTALVNKLNKLSLLTGRTFTPEDILHHVLTLGFKTLEEQLP